MKKICLLLFSSIFVFSMLFANGTVQAKDTKPPKTLTVNPVSDQTITVTGKTEAKASVEVKLGSKSLGKATADSKGNYKVRIKVQKAGNKLTVIARDKAKNTKIVKVTIGDKTAPKTLTVNKVTNITTSVTGKTETKASIEVKLGSNLLGKATADSKGNYQVKIKAQKEGNKLTVIAKDKAGNAKKVTVTVYETPKPLNVSKTVEKDGIKFDVTFSTKDFKPNGELTANIKATNISEEAIPYVRWDGCDRGVRATIFADDNGQVFTGSQKPNGLSCNQAVWNSTLLPGETIEASQVFYLPTNGLNDHVYAKVTFQKGSNASYPLEPIEVLIDIYDFQDDEPFTLVNKSELSVEQQLLIEAWKRTKGVYRLDDLYVIAAGPQPNPGYRLEIVKTETSWEQVTVYVQVTKAKLGSQIQVISYPYIIGKMNLAPYTTLRFVDAGTGETIPVTKSGLNDE